MTKSSLKSGNLTQVFALLKIIKNPLKYGFWLSLFISVLSAAVELFSFRVLYGIFFNLAESASVVSPVKSKADIAQSISIDNFNISEHGLIFLCITLILASSLLKIGTLSYNALYSALIGEFLSKKGFSSFLHKPYLYHIKQHTSNIVNTLSSDISKTVTCLNMFLTMISSALLGLGIWLGVSTVNYRATMATFFIIGVIYYIIYLSTKNKLSLNSVKLLNHARAQIKEIQEAASGIRDIIISDLFSSVEDSFAKIERPYRLTQAKTSILTQSPKCIVEGLIYACMLLALIFLTSSRSKYGSEIASFGIVAVALQKSLPLFQQLFYAWSNISVYESSMAAVIDTLDCAHTTTTRQPANVAKLDEHYISSDKSNRCGNRHGTINSIEFCGVCYAYEDKSNYVLKDINFKINQGDNVGIYGTSGSGKSTLVDILMLLLEPVEGDLCINGRSRSSAGYNELLSMWSRSISHVPQNPILYNSTILHNITGSRTTTLDSIDQKVLMDVCNVSYISEYINSLPDGFNATIEERGINMSGGQRQRLAIARALYTHKEVLVLDEATSAIDSTTKASILSELYKIKSEATIIAISHDPADLIHCSRIFKLEHGALTEVHQYSDYISSLKPTL